MKDYTFLITGIVIGLVIGKMAERAKSAEATAKAAGAK